MCLSEISVFRYLLITISATAEAEVPTILCWMAPIPRTTPKLCPQNQWRAQSRSITIVRTIYAVCERMKVELGYKSHIQTYIPYLLPSRLLHSRGSRRPTHGGQQFPRPTTTYLYRPVTTGNTDLRREADQRGTPDIRERPPCVHTIRVTRRSRGPRRPAGLPEVTSGLMLFVNYAGNAAPAASSQTLPIRPRRTSSGGV